MPIRQPFYLNADNLSSATAVFLDAALTMCAPDGFYSDGNIVRELVDCVLLPLQQCPNCCTQPCTSWRAVGGDEVFVLKYGVCGNRGVRVDTYDPNTTVDICIRGTDGEPPNVLQGNPVLTINQNCGCCAGPCETWSIINVTENVTVSYTRCDGTSGGAIVNVGSTLLICILSGTLPVINSGDALVQFDTCDCID
jgi:hypothetical protein